jgi:hypothetical protein
MPLVIVRPYIEVATVGGQLSSHPISHLVYSSDVMLRESGDAA